MPPAAAAAIIEESPPETRPRKDHTSASPLKRRPISLLMWSATSNPLPGTETFPIRKPDTGEPPAIAQLGANNIRDNIKKRV
jgi:hypothetical protein